VLASAEVHSSKLLLLQFSQRETYPEVLQALAAGKTLPRSHALSAYNVSIDSNRLLCISGRVRRAENFKLPQSLIPFSLKSQLTRLLFTSYPGFSSMLCILSGTYHIAAPRSANGTTTSRSHNSITAVLYYWHQFCGYSSNPPRSHSLTRDIEVLRMSFSLFCDKSN